MCRDYGCADREDDLLARSATGSHLSWFVRGLREILFVLAEPAFFCVFRKSGVFGRVKSG